MGRRRRRRSRVRRRWRARHSGARHARPCHGVHARRKLAHVEAASRAGGHVPLDHQLLVGTLDRDNAHAEVLGQRALRRQAVARGKPAGDHVVANRAVEKLVEGRVTTRRQIVVEQLTLSPSTV